MRTLNVSPTVLADVLACETRGWVRHVKGYTSPDESIKAVAGQAIHAAIAEFLRDAPLDKDGRAVRAFHDVYDPAFARCAADDLPDVAYTPANLERLVARWCEMHPPSAVPWKRVLAAETAFCSREWTIGDTRVRLIVRPDILVEDKSGFIRWVDTKTTGWHIIDKNWRRSLRLSIQAQLYTDAVGQKYSEHAALGGWFNAMELRTLPSAPKRVCKDHKKPYAQCGDEHVKTDFIEAMTTPERVERAMSDAVLAAEDIVLHLNHAEIGAIAMNGTAKDACRFCFAAEWCEASRPVEALDGMLLHEPWVVEEGERA